MIWSSPCQPVPLRVGTFIYASQRVSMGLNPRAKKKIISLNVNWPCKAHILHIGKSWIRADSCLTSLCALSYFCIERGNGSFAIPYQVRKSTGIP